MIFTKMHGLGNDYIFIDLFNNDLELNNDQLSIMSKILSDRHFGVGSDGLIVISKSEIADFKMQIFNSDGSMAEMCGNGLRCASAYAYLRGITKNINQKVETDSGIKNAKLFMNGNDIESVLVDLGEPIVYDRVNTNIDDNDYIITPISMGNPHVVTLVNSLDLDVDKIGKILSNKYNANVEFIKYIDPNSINMRVYERGVGETYACGTGAGASAVFTYLNGLTNRKVKVNLLGGNLDINYSDDNHVYLKGPVEVVYSGALDQKKILKLVNNTINSR